MKQIQLSDHFTFGRLLRFTWPSILLMFFASIYSIVDGIFVSNFVGKTSFAAVNLIMPVLMLIAAAGVMIGAGGSALVAKYLGEQRKKRANQVFSMLIYVALAFGIVASVTASVFMGEIVTFLGAEGEFYSDAVLYGRIAALGGIAFILQHAFYSFLVVAERPKMGFGITVIAGVMNIALDALFILVFDWGLFGAALATALSQSMGGFIPLVFFFAPNKTNLRLGKACFNRRDLVKTLTNGSSELVSNIAMSVVSILYNYQLIKMAGDTGVAAYGALMYTSYIFITFFMGYAFGRAPIVSYHYGAGNTDELKNLFKKDCTIIGIGSVLLTVASELMALPLAKIFGGYDPELFAMIKRSIAIYSFAYLLMGFNMAGSSFFTALNNGPVSAAISFLRTLVFEVIAVLTLPVLLGLDGIWASGIVAEIASFIFTASCIFIFRKRYKYL
ncbi:MAG: MATE family efflux transporter [Fibrobacter sp.]|nr:MATE family efflux transporter [Fibrobacter sp.]